MLKFRLPKTEMSNAKLLNKAAQIAIISQYCQIGRKRAVLGDFEYCLRVRRLQLAPRRFGGNGSFFGRF